MDTMTLDTISKEDAIRTVHRISQQKHWKWESDIFNRNNFITITDIGSTLKHTEYRNWRYETISFWSVRFKDGIVINGTYAQVIRKFCEDYLKSKVVINL